MEKPGIKKAIISAGGLAVAIGLATLPAGAEETSPSFGAEAALEARISSDDPTGPQSDVFTEVEGLPTPDEGDEAGDGFEPTPPTSQLEDPDVPDDGQDGPELPENPAPDDSADEPDDEGDDEPAPSVEIGAEATVEGEVSSQGLDAES